jgi:tetratricopeptide (TPR) repeat protein
MTIPEPLLDGAALRGITATMSSVLRLVRRGNFSAALHDPAFGKLETVLRETRRDSTTITDDWANLTSRSLVAEVYDQTGNYVRSGALLEHVGPIIVHTLGRQHRRTARAPAAIDARNQARRLVRARVYVTMHYAIWHFRKNRFRDARSLLERCIDLIQNPHEELTTQSFPWHGTLAHLNYWLGQVARQEQAYPEAEAFFRRSMEYFYRSVDHHWRKHASKGCPISPCERCRDRAGFANYGVASCMAFGLGWVRYRMGDLDQATSLLLPARTILRGSADDAVRIGYANLLLGAVRRAIAGANSSSVVACEEAITMIGEALKTFDQYGHELYSGRACAELALAYTNLARTKSPSAAKAIKHAEAFNRRGIALAKKHDDTEYACLGLIVSSRIACERGDYDEAVEAATGAEQAARLMSQGHGEAESLIARGEAHLGATMSTLVASDQDAERLRAAQRDFGTALRSGGRNPRIVAVCNLQLARIYARLGAMPLAARCFEAWTHVEREVQNGWIRGLAEKVQHEVYPPETLIINMADLGSRNVYVSAEERLRAFLMERALSKPRVEDRVAFLGVSRGTYFNWQKDKRPR